ncbi:hypothetical protein CYY_000400 [Polysphondylium violaceum]|uniref:Chitinase n=1 Tax=Polysphondylium violaceum TaxID=133409 RepID=A0A8J4Q1N0_9MYCE|nr:hypothetical protein CYY_000400 [Polysphondylium violaceum]
MYLLILQIIVIIIISLKGINGTCKSIQVGNGDTCYGLAQKCGLDLNTFYSFNPSFPNGCNFIQVGQSVCCGAGGVAPSQNSDGSCSIYTIKSGDFCFSIAKEKGITVEQLESFNTKVWFWKGCTAIKEGMKICVSPGSSPRPAVDPKAECGPSAKNYNSTCPLNVCCSEFGYCGTTKEFCEKKNSPTNAPGTMGCLSNCETGYQPTSGPPEQFLKIGYYESWASKRDCLNMDISNLDQTLYSHIHYAFGIITPDQKILIEDSTTFEKFKSLKSVKKILSFGGWAFSTEAATVSIFRNSMSPANRARFVQNLVTFANNHNLDGIDIDWEYPGAIDIGGMEGDGDLYVPFLKELKYQLKSKSLSIAAPASYWYLKNFPIKEISQIVDYIVFMTYDLHGSWDSNIPSLGAYLKSHVNLTETMDALRMITKAGVASNKIIMGVGLYGRSFQQTSPDCWGPPCTFSLNPGASPGRCTKTSGYLGLGEIREIKDVRTSFYDTPSDSQIVTYGTNQWIAYQTPSIIRNRIAIAQSMNLGGIVYWAIDLEDTKTHDEINKKTSDTDDDGDGDKVVSIQSVSNKDSINRMFGPWEIKDSKTCEGTQEMDQILQGLPVEPTVFFKKSSKVSNRIYNLENNRLLVKCKAIAGFVLYQDRMLVVDNSTMKRTLSYKKGFTKSTKTSHQVKVGVTGGINEFFKLSLEYTFNYEVTDTTSTETTDTSEITLGKGYYVHYQTAYLMAHEIVSIDDKINFSDQEFQRFFKFNSLGYNVFVVKGRYFFFNAVVRNPSSFFAPEKQSRFAVTEDELRQYLIYGDPDVWLD